MVNEKIFLIGLPASGKTTYAEKLAQNIGLPFFDLDNEIEKSTSQTISEIFEEKGEDQFRVLEKEHLERITQQNLQFVMSTGGGTPCFFENMKFMNVNGVTIYINTPLNKISNRLKIDDSRPLMKNTTIEDLYNTRRSYYEQAQIMVRSFDELSELF